eukprot:6173003-Pleurochrysis_carterae.AAC.2
MQAAVSDILKKYKEETGRSPYVVVGSSVGALEFGKRVVTHSTYVWFVAAKHAAAEELKFSQLVMYRGDWEWVSSEIHCSDTIYAQQQQANAAFLVTVCNSRSVRE